MKQRGQGGLLSIGDLLADILPPELSTPDAALPEPVKAQSERANKRTGRVIAVRENREQDKQPRIGYLARPFILCGLPFKKPENGVAHYKRENGDEVFEITTSSDHGLPFGMDYEVLIWVSTLAKHAMMKNEGNCPRSLEFASGADFLKAFDLPLDGRTYRRAQNRFLRVFYSTFFYGKKNQARARMFRVHFFDEIDLWFTKDLDSQTLPGDDFKNNRIVLSEKFAADLERFLLPIELDTVIAWANNPTQVYFNMWLGWRCYTARGGEKIPLMGPGGLKQQCGFDGYDGSRGALNFRRKVTKLLDGAKTSWPDCPVELVIDDPTRHDYLLIKHRASPIREKKPKRIN
jgi:Replication initiator protein A